MCAALPNDFEELEDRLIDPPANDSDTLPTRLAHYLRLADIALLNAAREEQRHIKERIRPSVENYRKLTGKTSP